MVQLGHGCGQQWNDVLQERCKLVSDSLRDKGQALDQSYDFIFVFTTADSLDDQNDQLLKLL